MLYGADGKYATGMFDGKTFTPDGPKQQLWHGNFYAAQAYSNDPQGRIVQIGWGQGIEFRGMPFNQQMVLPVELTLHKAGDRIEMHAAPVAEVKSLRGFVNNHVALQSTNGAPSESVFDNSTGYHWSFTLTFDGAKSAQLSFGTLPLKIDVAKSTLTCGNVTVPVQIQDGALTFEAFVDRGSVELFLNGGATAVSVGSDLSNRAQILKLTSSEGTVSLKGHGVNLKSIGGK